VKCRVFALDTEGRREPAEWIQITDQTKTVVFRLCVDSWEIVRGLLAQKGCITAVFNLTGTLKSHETLNISDIQFQDTQKDLREGLNVTYARLCNRDVSRKKKKTMWSKHETDTFYAVFDIAAESLPRLHLRYAAADAIATRAIYNAAKAANKQVTDDTAV